MLGPILEIIRDEFSNWDKVHQQLELQLQKKEEFTVLFIDDFPESTSFEDELKDEYKEEMNILSVGAVHEGFLGLKKRGLKADVCILDVGGVIRIGSFEYLKEMVKPGSYRLIINSGGGGAEVKEQAVEEGFDPKLIDVNDGQLVGVLRNTIGREFSNWKNRSKKSSIS